MRKYFKLKIILSLIIAYLIVKYFLINKITDNYTSNTNHDLDKNKKLDPSSISFFNFFRKSSIDDPIEHETSGRDYDKYQIFTDNLVNKNYLDYKLKSPLKASSKLDWANKHRINEVNKKFYVILEYTKIFYANKYCNFKLKNQHYSNHSLYRHIYDNSQKSTTNGYYDLLDDCLYSNCYFTCDRSLVKQANVILFHETDLKEDLYAKYGGDGGNINQHLNEIAPFSDRTSSKIWLLWNDEANSVDKFLDVFKFNWTLSYKSSSEVSYGAYGVYKYKLESQLGPGDKEDFYKKLRVEFDARANRAVWFNSNCKSKLRIQYAQDLSLSYPLALFGKCNDIIKSINRNNKVLFNDTECARSTPCENDVLKLNKFYLAFESKNCSDYITEKYWRSLSFNIIPIVLQPSKRYYERLVPPNSFIHFEDFQYDAKKLASYLHKLSNDFELYKKYFEWKMNFEIIHDMRLEKLRMCELCAKLNKETDQIYYESVSGFFNDECIVN